MARRRIVIELTGNEEAVNKIMECIEGTTIDQIGSMTLRGTLEGYELRKERVPEPGELKLPSFMQPRQRGVV